MCQGQCKFQTFGDYTVCHACGFKDRTVVFQAAFDENEDNEFDYEAWAKQENESNENDQWENEFFRPVRQSNTTENSEG